MKLRTECNLKEENLMKFYNSLLAIVMLAVVAASGMDRIVDAADAPPPSMGFFVTSAKSKTGNLGGLAGADKICQDLATTVGQGDKTWRGDLRGGGDPGHKNKQTKGPDRNRKRALVKSNRSHGGQTLTDPPESTRRANRCLRT